MGWPLVGETPLTTGPDGDVWFVEPQDNEIGRITPDGLVDRIAICSTMLI